MRKEKGLLRAYLLLILTTAIWGFQPVCLKGILPEWNAVSITAVRLAVFGPLLIVTDCWQEGRWRWPRRDCWLTLLVLGAAFMLNNVLQFSGIRYTTVGNVTLICALGPVLTAVLGAVFLRERLSLLAWLGIAVSFAGTLTIITDGEWSMLARLQINPGDILCFFAQLCWTLYALASVKILKKMSVLAVTGWSVLFSAVLVAGWGTVTGELAVSPLSPLAIGALLYTVFLGGIFALLSWNWGVNIVGPGVSSVFLNIMPVVGVMSGCLLLGETVDAVRLAGAAAIITGVYLTTRGAG